MSRKHPQKKRSAKDFLAMLSEIVVQENGDEENTKNDNDSSTINILDKTIDITKDLPEIQFEGAPILFNEWFNVCDKKFNLDKTELKLFQSSFGLCLSTSNILPKGPIELHKQLSVIQDNINTISNDILAPTIFDYRDFLYVGNENSRFRQISALHVVNHIYRDFEAKESRQSVTIRDSNFTPTTILVICPYKQQAHRFIKEIIKCLPDKVMVKKEKEEEQEKEKEETKQASTKRKHHKHSESNNNDKDEYVEQQFQIENFDKLADYTVENIPQHYLRTRADDWLETFGGNNEDDFKIGIRFFSNKISLFQEISKSQLVIASPLALSLFDQKNFMSSIEVLVLDSIDVLVMQHADRLAQVIAELNSTPKTVDQTDWSRLRQYCADKNHKKMRQSIGYGRIITPEIYCMYNQTFVNIRGQLIVRPLKYPMVLKPGENIERSFKKIIINKGLSNSNVNSDVELIGDAIFKTFSEKIFPMIKQWRSESEEIAKRTIIYFVSSYRFLQARKMLDDDLVNFLELSDESTTRDTSNMKKSFKADSNAVLLLTERHYFTFRPKLQAGRVIFLQPPSYPLFAEELAGNCSSTVYFSEFDEFALERVAGSDHFQKILSSDLYSY